VFAEAGIAAQQVFIRYLLIGSVVGLVTFALVFRSRIVKWGLLIGAIRLACAAVLGGVGFILGAVLVGGAGSRLVFLNLLICTGGSCVAALLAGIRLPVART
jgi:hypothetical protein